MTPTDSIFFLNLDEHFHKKGKKGRKSLRKRVYKSDGTHTVLSHAFPLTLSVSDFICASGV